MKPKDWKHKACYTLWSRNKQKMDDIKFWKKQEVRIHTEECSCQRWKQGWPVFRGSSPLLSLVRVGASRLMNYHLPCTGTHTHHSHQKQRNLPCDENSQRELETDRAVLAAGAAGDHLWEHGWWPHGPPTPTGNKGEWTAATARTPPLKQAENWACSLNYKNEHKMKKHQTSKESQSQKRDNTFIKLYTQGNRVYRASRMGLMEKESICSLSFLRVKQNPIDENNRKSNFCIVWSKNFSNNYVLPPMDFSRAYEVTALTSPYGIGILIKYSLKV